MKKLIGFGLLLAAPGWSSNGGASNENIVLQTGEQTIVKMKGTPSLTVTNPGVAKIIPGTHEFRIIGRQPGIAEIMLSKPMRKFKVTVFSSKVAEARRAILSWLKGTYGMRLETLPDKILLHGRAMRLNDWLEIQDFISNFRKWIVSDVQLSDLAGRQLEFNANAELRRRSISTSKVIFKGGEIEMTAPINDREKIAAAEIASRFGIKEMSPGSNVELRPMVEVEILIAEMKKNAMRELGLKPPESYSATVLPAGDLSSTSVTFNSFVPELHAYFSRGMGRVLANPKLICRSGEAAHFVAGGEIPIKIISWRNSDVIWKRYGVILDITPLADLNEAISTKITTEISLLDEAHKVDGIPGFLTNRIDTHFDLRGSKTIALSGLIKSEVGRNSNGVALLGEIPILGELFKSREYQENRTELIIFVTPKVISAERPPPPPPPPIWTDDE